ncbi:MAG TPA: ATP-binding cassette domain-containing protein [Terrimicrobiaceae bacterium]
MLSSGASEPLTKPRPPRHPATNRRISHGSGGSPLSLFCVAALDEVRLQIWQGTIMGENGVRKSTSMKIIAGIYQPDTGEIRLKGEPVKLTTPLAAPDASIATIHPELNLMPNTTVAGEHMDSTT